MASSRRSGPAVPSTQRHARKRFGQHFLTDPAATERIFAVLRCRQSEHILEIGPGTGSLTDRLSREAGRVTAIEIDRDLAAALQARLPAVAVLCGDALTIELAPCLGSDRTTRVVGNLPYNVATPLLGRLFGISDRVADMHFMLQAEVAERLIARPGTKSYGRLSVMAQYHCSIERLFDVDARSFTPAPKVRSAFVRLVARPREPCNIRRLADVVRIAFGQRRKTLHNALKPFAPDWQALGLDPGARAENLRVEDFVAIANQVASRSHDVGEALPWQRPKADF